MMMNDFVSKVRTLRFLQKSYFKTRDKNTLNECKKAEREVDEELKRLERENEETLWK